MRDQCAAHGPEARADREFSHPQTDTTRCECFEEGKRRLGPRGKSSHRPVRSCGADAWPAGKLWDSTRGYIRLSTRMERGFWWQQKGSVVQGKICEERVTAIAYRDCGVEVRGLRCYLHQARHCWPHWRSSSLFRQSYEGSSVGVEVFRLNCG